jgi:predicted metalloendopeptidase
MTVSSGLDLSTLDRTVSPADDFYKFCNGNWKDEIPKDKSSWDFFGQVLRDFLFAYFGYVDGIRR